MKKIKVLVVEDQLLIRSGIRFHLNEIKELSIIGEATNGQEFLELIKKKMPDVVLMDINMPVMNGIEASHIASQQYPELKILVLSSLDDEENLAKILAEGVKGYLLKSIGKDELREAILKVAEGKNYFSPELLPALTNTLIKKDSQKEDDAAYKLLTAREIEVLQCICHGLTDKEIGEKLFISPRTAGGHRFNLLKKTGCKNTVGLIFFAIKHGWLKPE